MVKWLFAILTIALLQSNMASISLAEDVIVTEEEALKLIFPGLKDIKKEKQSIMPNELEKFYAKMTKEYEVKLDKEYDKEFKFYSGLTEAGEISHYAYIGKTPGKWGPITYIVGIAKNGKIKNVIVMNLSERRGKPICNRKFLDQYINKGSVDPLRVKEDIKAVSGATISSKAMNGGIKKALALFDVFYLKKK